jgi:CHC2 zinc finger/Toprim-like
MITNKYAYDGLDAIDFQRIRQLHPLVEYCESQGIDLRRTSNRWIGKCPLHDERNGTAFVIHPDEKWQCYGKCGRQGDVIDLERELHGGTITEAARRLDGNTPVGVNPALCVSIPPIGGMEIPRLVPTKENPFAFPYILSDQEIGDCHRFRVRLLADRPYMEQIARFRQWKYETLYGLALDGYLGRDDEGHFCLNSAAGCKTRWRQDGERRFKFLFGKNWLWRAELIPQAETIYLCEGETDAITLIDRGIEEDGETVAIGVQGATLNIEPWAFLFTEKKVVIAMDDDEAGWKADARIERTLSGKAKSIEHFWSIKEVA